MFGFVRVIALRMRTIAVVELDYRRKLEVAGGPDSSLFNKATRLAHEFGGNEYDAAALFVMVDGVGAFRRAAAGDMTVERMAEVYQRNTAKMAQAHLTEEALRIAVRDDGR